MKKKIIIDLDVVTIGIWKKADERRVESLKFIKRVENKEFEVVMLSSTLNLVEKWNNIGLSTSIKDFYYTNTSHFIDDAEIFNFLISNKVSASEIIDEFLKKHIKHILFTNRLKIHLLFINIPFEKDIKRTKRYHKSTLFSKKREIYYRC